jgi:hypothetical protein
LVYESDKNQNAKIKRTRAKSTSMSHEKIQKFATPNPKRKENPIVFFAFLKRKI